jgi:2-polyprenyl-6-methoxyphenol hydroxylase-like FAD-dependent oxidoreductase
MFVSDRGFLGAFPLKGPPGSYRLILVSQADQNALTPDISSEEFSSVVDSRAPEPIEIDQYCWLSRFNLHHRMAKRFRSGRMFLAGDAAHIHSPVFGQGMNTGIQDALNLGPKLAAVLRRGKDLPSLDRYEAERLPVAHNVLQRTDRAFRSVMALNTSRWRYLRLWVAPYIVGLRPFQKRLARLMSQVDVARHEMQQRENELQSFPKVGQGSP